MTFLIWQLDHEIPSGFLMDLLGEAHELDLDCRPGTVHGHQDLPEFGVSINKIGDVFFVHSKHEASIYS